MQEQDVQVQSHRPHDSADAVRPGSLRRRILDYIEEQGGELRADSSQSLSRQICDALGERSTRVSQALIALQRSGLLEREMDLRHQRCQAVRLVHRRPGVAGTRSPHHPHDHPRNDGPTGPLEGSSRQRAELAAAEQELNDLIRKAAEASRRVAKLRWALLRASEQSYAR